MMANQYLEFLVQLTPGVQFIMLVSLVVLVVGPLHLLARHLRLRQKLPEDVLMCVQIEGKVTAITLRNDANITRGQIIDILKLTEPINLPETWRR